MDCFFASVATRDMDAPGEEVQTEDRWESPAFAQWRLPWPSGALLAPEAPKKEEPSDRALVTERGKGGSRLSSRSKDLLGFSSD